MIRIESKYTFLISVFVLFGLGSCSKLVQYKTRYQHIKQVQKQRQKQDASLVFNDTVQYVRHRKQLIPKRLIQFYQQIYLSNDTLWIKTEKWTAFRRVSPNSLQIIKRTEELYVQNVFIYEKTEVLSLLLFDSSHKTTVRYRTKSGEIKIIEKEGPYDEMEYGLDGVFEKKTDESLLKKL